MNKKNVIINFIWRFFERISAQLVTFVVSIILARLLEPEDYGAIAIIMVFITFANILVCNGFATALIQKKNADELDFSSVFYFSLLFSILLYLILYILAPLIADWYNMEILKPTLRILGLRIIIGSINSVQHSYVSKKMIFKKFFLSTIGGTIISAIVGIIMAYLGFGVWALVFQYLINTFIATLVLWITVKWRPIKAFSITRLKQLLSYGWKLLVSALVGTIYDDLRTLIMGKVYSSTDLAYYTRGQQFPKLIMTNVNTSINSVIFPVMSSMQDDLKRLKNAARKTLQASASVISPIMFGLAAVARPIVKILLTDKWLPCVPYLQLCCIFYLISSIYSLYLQIYKSLGRSGLALIIELVDNILGIILVFIFYKKGVLAVAIIMVLSRLVACLICIIINKKITKMNYKEQFNDVFIPIFFSILMYIVVMIVGKIKIHYVIKMIIQIICGVIFYLLLCVIFKFPILDLIKDFFKKRKRKV